MCRMLAATAARDRAASRPLSESGIAFVAQVAVGRSENGGGSKRRFGFGFGEDKEKTFGFQQGAEGTNPRGGALTLIADVGMGTNSHGHRQAGDLAESFT